jgi:hypothetical protein
MSTTETPIAVLLSVTTTDITRYHQVGPYPLPALQHLGRSRNVGI